MVNCQNCGKINLTGMSKCYNCGASLSQLFSSPPSSSGGLPTIINPLNKGIKFCDQCGAKNNGTAKFCSSCQHSIVNIPAVKNIKGGSWQNVAIGQGTGGKLTRVQQQVSKKGSKSSCPYCNHGSPKYLETEYWPPDGRAYNCPNCGGCWVVYEDDKHGHQIGQIEKRSCPDIDPSAWTITVKGIGGQRIKSGQGPTTGDIAKEMSKWYFSLLLIILGIFSGAVIPIIGLPLGMFLILQGISEFPFIPRKPKYIEDDYYVDEVLIKKLDNRFYAFLRGLVLNPLKGGALVWLAYSLNPFLAFIAAIGVYLAFPVVRVVVNASDPYAEIKEKESLIFYSYMTIAGKFAVMWLLVASLYFAFGSGMGAFTLPFIFLVCAFFVVGGFGEVFELIKPDLFGEEQSRTIITLRGKEKKRNMFSIIFYLIGTVFCILALIIGLPSFSGNYSWVYGLVVSILPIYTGLGTLVGSAMHPRSLPMIGIPVILTVFILLTVAQTGTVGQSMFGNYWPTVEHYGSMILTPIGQAYDQMAEGMSDAYLMMTCPTCYAQKQMDKQQASATHIKDKGSAKSIELVEFKAINYGTGTPTIDPSIPLIGSIQLENKGEFTAKSIKVTLLSPKRKDPVNTGTGCDGSFDCPSPTTGNRKCTYTALLYDSCGFTSCTGVKIPLENSDLNRPDVCDWPEGSGTISPGDLKAMSFVCGQDLDVGDCTDSDGNAIDCKKQKQDAAMDFRQWSPSDLNKCICENEDGDTKSSTDCTCDTAGYTAGYEFARNYAAIKMKYEFGYDVTANGKVAIMDATTYDEKLMRKEIRPSDSESKYSGGPVMISIWQQDQPLRSGTDSYATISIFNNGDGILLEGAKLTITIPKENILPTIEVTKQPPLFASSGGLRLPDPLKTEDDDYYIFDYVLATQDLSGLEKGESAKITFMFTGELGTDVLEKTSIIVASLDYDYTREKLLEFPIIQIPIQ